MQTSKYNFFILIGILLAFLAACSPKKEANEEVLLQGKTMGTTFSIKIYAEKEQLQQLNLLESVNALLVDVNQSMSTYIADSEINQFNRLPANTEVAMSEDFRRVTAESIRLGKSTGTLDVTMGPLIDLWGFGPDKRPTKLPSDELINSIQSQIGVGKLSLTEQGLSKSVDKLALSYSAIAKGFGIDKVAEFLESKGLTSYMVEIGGEIRVGKAKPNGEPWRLAIEQPDAPLGERKVHKILSLTEQSMATSGDYRIFFEMDGVHYSHLINPETGKPILRDLVSVTVIHPSAMTADGLATALTVMGTERALAYAEQHNLPVYLISKTETGLVSRYSNAFTPYL